MAGSETTGLSWFNILVLGCGLVVGAFIGYMLRLVTDVRKAKRAEKEQVAGMIEQFRHARLGEAKPGAVKIVRRKAATLEEIRHAKHHEALQESDYYRKTRKKTLREIRDKLDLCCSSVAVYDEKTPVSEAFVESMLITFVNLRSAVRIAPENYLKEDDGVEIIEDTMKELLIAVNTIDECKGEPINREKLQEKRNAAAAWLEKHIST